MKQKKTKKKPTFFDIFCLLFGGEGYNVLNSVSLKEHVNCEYINFIVRVNIFTVTNQPNLLHRTLMKLHHWLKIKYQNSMQLYYWRKIENLWKI